LFPQNVDDHVAAVSTIIDTPTTRPNNSADIPDLTAILRRLKQWHTDHRDELATAGLTTRLREPAPDWPKTSISLALESGPRLSQLTVWDSGETETRPRRHRHRNGHRGARHATGAAD
jgi:hypothetical protein